MKTRAPLPPDSVCRILSLGEDARIARRLAQMGILPGMEVTVIRTGPFGDPLEVRVDSGEALLLRTEEAQSLQYEILSLPLAALMADGETYRVNALHGGMGFQQKMAQLGVEENTRFVLVRDHPYELHLEPGKPVVLGRGEAEKIIVEPVSEHG